MVWEFSLLLLLLLPLCSVGVLEGWFSWKAKVLANLTSLYFLILLLFRLIGVSLSKACYVLLLNLHKAFLTRLKLFTVWLDKQYEIFSRRTDRNYGKLLNTALLTSHRHIGKPEERAFIILRKWDRTEKMEGLRKIIYIDFCDKKDK